jgi:hypothetical protein
VTNRTARRVPAVLVVVAFLSLAGVSAAAAAPEGTLTIAMHFTPVTRWHQIQNILHEQVVQAPVYHLGFPIGVGPRVETSWRPPSPASTSRRTRT